MNSEMDRMKEIADYTVDVIIPVYHPDKKFHLFMERLCKQTKRPDRIILLHTQDVPGEVLPLPVTADKDLIEILPIAKKDFDHGGTRKYGASHSDADILVFMTQDAVPADEYLIEQLLQPYENPNVAATYGRQLPKKGADILESYTRAFNYPKISRVKSKKDVRELGIKTFYCSNVCASYRNDVYRLLGGFVDRTIFNEDMIMAYAMIEAGYSIAYNAQARVVHSHHYTAIQQFKRNFDLGVSHKEYEDVFGHLPSETEGIKLVKQTMRYLIKQKKPLWIPNLILTSGAKYLGYRAGKNYTKLPKRCTVCLSMNKGYWND